MELNFFAKTSGSAQKKLCRFGKRSGEAMQRKGIKSYLAGFLVAAMLAGFLAVPPTFGAAGYETGNKSSERLKSGTGHTLKDKMRAQQKMRHEDMTADKKTERERELEQKIELQGEDGNG